MRNLLAALAVFLLFNSVTFAQFKKEKSVFGFKAGVNISGFRTAVDYADFESQPKAGQVFGGFVNIPVSPRWSLQPEFLYSQLGTRSNSTTWGNATFRYNYFSMPLVMKYRITKCLNAFAGGDANFLIRATLKGDVHKEYVTNDIKDFDFAYTAGIGADSKRWTFDARYIHGTQDVSPDASHTTFFNKAIQATVGYKLIKKAKKPKASK